MKAKRSHSRELMMAAGERVNPEARIAYHMIMGVADARLEGKRFAPRRPPCGIKITLGDGLITAEFKPELVNSPEGWKTRRLFLNLKTNAKQTLQLEVRPDGTLRGKQWTVSTAETLLTIAERLLSLVARGEAYIMAAADADHCACCGRILTDPHSREAGIGPECIRYFYHHHDARVYEGPAPETIAEQVREIRRQMMAAHPDRGGSGDGALFASLSAELDRLREMMR